MLSGHGQGIHSVHDADGYAEDTRCRTTSSAMGIAPRFPPSFGSAQKFHNGSLGLHAALLQLSWLCVPERTWVGPVPSLFSVSPSETMPGRWWHGFTQTFVTRVSMCNDRGTLLWYVQCHYSPGIVLPSHSMHLMR